MSPKKDKKSTSRSRPGVRGGNIGVMVNNAISTIIALFLSLSSETRQDILRHLAALSGVVISTPQQVEQPVGGTASSSEPTNLEALKKQKSAKLQAFDRPIVSKMPYAIRHKARSKPDRVTPEGKADAGLLSAALAAMNRASKLKKSSAEIESALEGAGDDLTLIKKLFKATYEGSDPDGPQGKKDDTRNLSNEIDPVPPPSPVVQRNTTLAVEDGKPSAAGQPTDNSVEKPENHLQRKKRRRSYFFNRALTSQVGDAWFHDDRFSIVTNRRLPNYRFTGHQAVRRLNRGETMQIVNSAVPSVAIAPEAHARAFAEGQQLNFRALQDNLYVRPDGLLVVGLVPTRSSGSQETEISRETERKPPSQGDLGEERDRKRPRN